MKAYNILTENSDKPYIVIANSIEQAIEKMKTQEIITYDDDIRTIMKLEYATGHTIY